MVRQFITPLLFLTLVLSACASVNAVTPGPSGSVPFVETLSITPGSSPTTTTDITPTPSTCAYVWASQELPALSQKLYRALQAVDPSLTGNAYAYGENCVFADGHSTFSTMETDFRVKVNVSDLKDEKTLGDWIGRVLVVITKLPSDDILGPQPGHVEFAFSRSETENLFLNVSIAKFQKQPSGLSGAELFKLFNHNP